MLEVNQLTVTYNSTPVVDNVSFTLTDSEILMLVGPTGCGKTTILRALAGLVRPTAGRIRIGDQQITPGQHLAPEKRGVGMVFQDFALFPHMNVERNVAFRLKDPAPAHHWLELLGLADLKKAMPDNLSGGQKQRVALARSLAHSPRLMLLDEPLSHLDAALKDTLRWEIRQALKEAGVPAIWVTHDQEEALSVGDRVGVLRNGRLEQLDTAEACFCRPANRFVAGFLGEASFIPGDLRGGRAETAFGTVPAQAVDTGDGAVDLLARPDDLSLVPAADGGGRIEHRRYEGGSFLYSVRTDQGLSVRARTNHEQDLRIDDRVRVAITTTHPLAAFQREPA